MLQQNVFFRSATARRMISIFSQRNASTIDIDKLETESADVEVMDDESLRREEEIQRKRDKSRLRLGDRNFLHEQNPHPEPKLWLHGTLKYLRRTYGRYGAASGVNPAVCWPVKEELDEHMEYEKVAYPFTIGQMVERSKVEQREKEVKLRESQQNMVKKMEMLGEWKEELRKRVAKKEAEVLVAKERKARLVEEVRMHFGYKVDPKDEKFKEMLEKKEKEQKKAEKEERRLAREQKMITKLLSKKTHTTTEPENAQN